MTIKPFSKLTNALYEYRTTIKINISMACVSKEYEIKTKMVQQQWLQLKGTILLGFNLKINFLSCIPQVNTTYDDGIV